MKLKERYSVNQFCKIGDNCVCPTCQTEFVKEHYQQVFCKTKSGTKCKDKYWNTVTPNKRNNTTRISPANMRWQLKQLDKRYDNIDPHDTEHPFSSEALGQW